jgi:hypothetical protein
MHHPLWSPAPPPVQCLGHFPWGPWHAGKSIDFDNRNNHHTPYPHRLQHDGLLHVPRPSHPSLAQCEYGDGVSHREFPFESYQLLPIDATETMGNFKKSSLPDHSEIPNFRILDTVQAPPFKAKRRQFWGCKHQTNVSLRPMGPSTPIVMARWSVSLWGHQPKSVPRRARRALRPPALRRGNLADSYDVTHPSRIVQRGPCP